ncbi:thymic stromal cotransporter homolog [Pelobates cultripes]|uniref:Thymic stromal cotransporter homolog n=1 Tax=Pelobates cultripes TaxID=61616 RepID=A0AAD1S6A3_PELCU|nr:thymic stromal cotransporter homolog [Pelobates cultripes]
MIMIRTWIEPVVVGAQVAASFYDTGLLMTVRNHYNKTTLSSNSSSEDALQKAISNFYITYNVIMGLTPMLSAYILAKLGERISGKILICVPLAGYLVSRLFLLFVILWDWPIEVIFGSAALNGLTGWFTTYWAGVMAWASQSSSESRRSLRLIIIEMVYGLAGFVGSLVSGHIFIDLNLAKRQGVILACCSTSCYAFCVLYSIFILKMPDSTVIIAEKINHENEHVQENLNVPINSEYTEQSRLLDNKLIGISTPHRLNGTPSKLILILLFMSAILLNVASIGAEDVINVFVLKKPLSWGPVEVGYGYAALYVTCITSFLGVLVFSKCFGDPGLIVIGILSFSAGILIMAFVQWTYMYYVARAVMMFSLIPTPTIRSMISKHVEGSSYGKIFVVLQLGIEIVGVSSSAGFNKLYQATLDWYSGFCFIVFSSLGFVSIIPIIITACLQRSRTLHSRSCLNGETAYGSTIN